MAVLATSAIELHKAGTEVANPHQQPAGLAAIGSLAAQVALIETPGDARRVADNAAALRDLAKRARATAVIVNEAMTARLRAEVMLAQLVEEGQVAGQIARQGDPASRGCQLWRLSGSIVGGLPRHGRSVPSSSQPMST
jgi:hypothetical protein